MVDVHLFDKLSRPLKNKFQLAAEKYWERDPSVKDLAASYHYDTYIPSAMRLLASEGAAYLSNERFENLTACLHHIQKKLEAMDCQKEQIPDDLVQFFEIQEDVLESIYEIGVKKFEENDPLSSLSCFVLLSALDPQNEDYWYNEGMAAQSCSQTELALLAYSEAMHLSADRVGPLVFSAECLLTLERKDEANQALEKASHLPHEGWENLISYLKRAA